MDNKPAAKEDTKEEAANLASSRKPEAKVEAKGSKNSGPDTEAAHKEHEAALEREKAGKDYRAPKPSEDEDEIPVEHVDPVTGTIVPGEHPVAGKKRDLNAPTEVHVLHRLEHDGEVFGPGDRVKVPWHMAASQAQAGMVAIPEEIGDDEAERLHRRAYEARERVRLSGGFP